MTGLTPGREHIDQRHVALAQVGAGESGLIAEARQIERRRGLPDQRGRNLRGVAGAEPHVEQPRERGEGQQRRQREQDALDIEWNGRRVAHVSDPSPRDASNARNCVRSER